MGRKAQVTVFIILGIVLMGIFAAVLYITNSGTKQDFETEAAPIMEDVPQEFTAIQSYIQSCISSVGKKGMILLSQQGGYINPELLGDFSISNPTESVGINLDPVKVPYWHYNQNSNEDSTVSISSFMPFLFIEDDEYWSVEAQLSRYMDENINTCLNDFEVFEEQGFSFETGTIETTSRIQSDFLDFILEMPISVTKDDTVADMETFYQDLDVNFKEIYDIASEIAIAQNEKQFLEHHMLNILGLYTRPGGDFPPMLMTTVEDSTTDLWYTSEIKLSLKELLQSSIPLIRHSSSSNFYRFEFASENDLTALYQQSYDNMILDLSIESITSDTTRDISFFYLDWNPYLNINGGEEKIEPSTYKFASPLPLVSFSFTMQNYLNTYDIAFPALITIIDDESFKGEGLTFNFALEGNIVNNEVYDETYFEPAVIQGGETSLACDEEHKTSGPLSTLIVDAFTSQPIEFVDFSYTIPNVDSCFLGTSDDSGELDAAYPSVYGGMLNLKHEDYLDTSLVLDTASFIGESAIIGYAVAGLDTPVIELYQEKQIDVTVKHKQIQKCIEHIDLYSCIDKNQKNFEECQDDIITQTCFFNNGHNLFYDSDPVLETESEGSASKINQYYFVNSAKDLFTESSTSNNKLDGDYSFQTHVIMERVSDVGGEILGFIEQDFVTAFSVDKDNPTASIALYPGRYQVTAITLLEFEEDYVIPTDFRCSSNDEDECFEIEKSDFGSIIAGQTIMEEDEYIEITAQDLYGSDQLNLNVLGFAWENIPKTYTTKNEDGDDLTINARVIEDLELMGELGTLSQDDAIAKALQPTWD